MWGSWGSSAEDMMNARDLTWTRMNFGVFNEGNVLLMNRTICQKHRNAKSDMLNLLSRSNGPHYTRVIGM